MSRKRKQNHLEESKKNVSDKKLTKQNLARLLAMIGATAVIFAVYRFMMTQKYFEIVLGIYLAAATAVILGYVIYNRGFSRRGVTEDMLPNTWSAEQKREFIEDGEQRLRKSRPLLILIFAFAFTFVIDILELFALPLIQNIFAK
ncbi:MAG: hypothetical protein E7653_03745 [Ruminococcaceae bacterium]|nr:hypothetical protein [Oscillospiraceae bacterium]